ncbi:SLATT domain-containing protein [Gracilimonas sp.]|uniref:SLATT domain-containing protein n=1 Tax=Gracilimonas sp. TaxID=1974203 RepID=UPI0032F03F72
MIYEELLNRWHKTIRRYQVEHELSARFYEKLNWKFGIPAALLSTIVGAGIFADIEQLPYNNLIVFLGGFVSLLSAALIAVETFMKFGERFIVHKTTAVKYGELARSIQQVITCGPGSTNPEAFMEFVKETWNAIDKEAPTLRNSTIKAIVADPDGADPVLFVRNKNTDKAA